MLESEIYTVLNTNIKINRRVNTRIYPIVMPQDVTLPAITYQRISAQMINDLGGYSNLENPHIAINCWALGYAEAKVMANEVQDAMYAATTYKATLFNDLDVYEPDLNLFAVSMDFSCWYQG